MVCKAVSSDFYSKKIMLAPMVHAGRTPLRTLALEYGADLVYTEEIVDQKLLGSTRVFNEALGTIDYVVEDDIVLRMSSAREREKCILQVGTNSAERIAKLAKIVSEDVAAIDINMGCPKPFSIAGGMGAALLNQPDRVKEILTTLVSVSSIPVSCKIRVLDKIEDTLALAQLIEKCGVNALGVHGRRKDERRGDRNRTEEIREVARALTIPVIANGGSGEIKGHSDIEKFLLDTGASSVMIARKALTNPSIFRKSGGLATMEEEISNFLRLACEFEENFTMTKYVVQRILGSEQEFNPRGQKTVDASSVYEICKAWSMEETYRHYKELRGRKFKTETDETTGLHFVDVTFPPRRLKSYCGSGTPKCVLNAYCDENCIKRPVYRPRQRSSDKRYEAIIEVDGQRYLSRVGQPNKKMAEQVAALAALIGMKKRDRLHGEWEE